MNLNMKIIKMLLEAVKKRSNKLHFSKLILKYKDNMKKTQAVIEESIGKEKCNQQNFPKKVAVGKKNITNVKLIGENLYKYFTEICSRLAREITLILQEWLELN